MPPQSHPQESFGFQRLLIFAVKPLEVAIADSCGCLDINGESCNPCRKMPY
jgi:hypothetical protein